MSKIDDELFELRMQKSKCKSAFTKAKNKLINAVSIEEEIDKENIKVLQQRLDISQEDVTEIFERLCVVYKDGNDSESLEKVHVEMETNNSEYSNAYKTVHKALELERVAIASESDAGSTIEEPEEKKLGIDMWRQMKRVSIPVFYGDKRKYQSWYAAFSACIDKAPATLEYKLLQLRNYLSGEALKCIDNLGHSASAYLAAKERLERKYGGEQRQVSMFLEELESFHPFKEENCKSFERFADLLDIAVINLKEHEKELDLGDGALYIRLQKKMPESTLTRYNRWIFENKKIESVETLREWVIQEANFHMRANETVHGLSVAKRFDKKPERSYFSKAKSASRANWSTNEIKCKLCLGSHGVWNCKNFIQLPVSERWDRAKELKLCFRCLSDSHIGTNCPQKWQCRESGCKKNHHTLLHCEQEQHTRQDRVLSGTQDRSTYNTRSCRPMPKVALRTVPVILQSGHKRIRVNALLDDGSTKSYLNADIAGELGVSNQVSRITVNVLNGKNETFESMPVSIGLESLNGQIKKNVEVQTIKDVTGNLPAIDWNRHAGQYPHLREIPFPSIEQEPKVDLMIGLDYAELHMSLHEICGQPGEPIARLTPLGWTCVGSVKSESCETFHSFFVSDQQMELSNAIRRFWEVEQCGVNEKALSKNDEEVLISSEKTIKYDENSCRYEIGVPWKCDPTDMQLRNNYEYAKKRLENTEKKLVKNPEIETMYKKVIDSHIKKGYVRKVEKHEVESSENQWYLPHFPVIRPEKSTTKVRVVFDASAKSNGVSLNDMINQGPSLQNDLFDILVRFRSQSVAIMCDIQEMYLQVGIPLRDRKYHRFLWRDSLDSEPDIYEFSRLVFGVNASPFLAQLVSQCHARKHAYEFPSAANVILKDTYMDDSMTSVKNAEEGLEMYCQLSELWKRAGMHARKWLSNTKEVLEHVPAGDRVFEVNLCKDVLPSVKTLGVWWSAETDMFTFQFNEIDSELKMTKRSFFSKVATLYDPLGFITPYTMRAKIIMQELWLCGVDWDEELCEEQNTRIWQWFEELCDLDQIRISRNLSFHPTLSEIHTFVDASNQAYGAVVYVRNPEEDSVNSNIITSKSKVAPLKTISISRLELMAAVLGLKLTKAVCRALGYDIRKTVLWSDSMNVLYWIRNQSRLYKPFVANRLGEIHSQTEPEQWRYVPTKENPADLTTRGMTVSDLSSCELWWHGPQFLQESESRWPENKFKPNSEAKCEAKVKSVRSMEQTFHSVPNSDNAKSFRLHPGNFSCWKHYTRIVAWTNRFIENCQIPTSERNFSKELHLSEMQNAESRVIRSAQREVFKEEYKCLGKDSKLPSSSKLLQLNPFLDEDGVLRCNSRLKFVKYLSDECKYPIILPRNHYVTKLIARYYHEQGNHCGTNQTLSSLTSRYWVLSAREAIREVENECVMCKRLKARTDHQIMGPLPSFRAGTSMRAFNETAVDFAGPFLTKQGRGKPKNKRYLCLFTYMSSRAVHLEMAYSLDSDSFLNAYYRFVSRRGFPRLMLSDNGTNFVGAVRDLRELIDKLDQNKIVRNAANQGVEWKFIPPGAPHFGGVHESMIKRAKRAVFIIMGNADVTDEELHTAFSGAESLINSRPLTYQSSNPADDCVLTPNHFLFGQCGGKFAPESVDSERYNIRKRWRRVQELVKHFWSRWFQEFLPTLSARKKWHRERRDFAVRDVVMVIEPDSTRGCWTLGRIQQVHPGADGHVRVATVQTGSKLIKRPINRLCLLEENLDQSQQQ